MSYRHLIDNALLDLSFDSNQTRQAFERQAPKFIHETLLPVVEQVFDRFSNKDEHITIDVLELDLGTIKGSDYLNQLPNKLKQVLTVQLELLLSGQGKQPDAGLKRVSLSQSHFSWLKTFLIQGYMPWQFEQRQFTEAGAQQWLEQTVKDNMHRLLDLIKSDSRRDIIIERLVNQLSWSRLRRIDSELTAVIDRHWLLNATGQLRSFAYTLTQGIAEGRVKLLQPIWSDVISVHQKLLLSILHYYGQQRRIRKIIARKFSIPMLEDILLLLEPLEYPFIEQLLNSAQLFVPWQKTKQVNEQLQENIGKEQIEDSGTLLWEFTLGYLLVERGSRFNRKTYLGSLVRQMAAHHNLSHEDMLRSLTATLSTIAGHSKLRNDMTLLLGELAAESQLDMLPGGNSEALTAEQNQQSYVLWLTQLLRQGQATQLSEHWPALVSGRKPLLARLMRLHGKEQQIRQRWVRGFTESMLKAIVVVLEPGEHPFIEKIIDLSPSLYAEQAKQLTPKAFKSDIWTFVLSYLLAERGSTFNRRSFLQSVTKQMAAHRNIAYDALLVQLLQNLKNINIDSGLKQGLELILNELCLAEGIQSQSTLTRQKTSSEHSLQLSQLSQAILSLDIPRVEALWPELVKSHSKALRNIVIEHGRLLLIRQGLAKGLTDDTLLGLIKLLAPGFDTFIFEVISHSELFAIEFTVTPQPQRSKSVDIVGDTISLVPNRIPSVADKDIKQSLWEFSLSYLLVERGSQFNKQSYLASLVRQMAAHRNIDYRHLLLALHQMLAQNQGPGAIAPSVKSTLQDILKTLLGATGHEPAKPAVPALNQLQQSFAAYHQLKQVLKGQLTVTDTEAFAANLKLLLKHQPVLLQRLLKSAFAEQVDWHQTVRHMSIAQAKLLADIFLALTAGTQTLRQSPIAQAVEQFYSQLKHQLQQQRFLALLFSTLVKRQPVDLEAIFEAAEQTQWGSEHGTNLSLEGKDSPGRPSQKSATEKYCRQGIHSPTRQGSRVAPTDGPNPTPLLQRPPGKEQTPNIMETMNLNLATTSNTLSKISTQTIKEFKLYIEQLLNQRDSRLHSMVSPLLAIPAVANKMYDWLGGQLLGRLVMHLKPQQFYVINNQIQLMSNAVYALADSRLRTNVTALNWQYILELLFVKAKPFELTALVEYWLKQLLDGQNDKRIDRGYMQKALVMQLLTHILPSTEGLIQSMVATIKKMPLEAQPSNELADLPVEVEASFDGNTVQQPGKPWTQEEEPEPEVLERLYVGNAGLVLMVPYIPRLFTTLGVTQANAFNAEQDEQLAIHLLQYAVTGEQATREYQLILNKLLCGVKTAKPVSYEIELTSQQTQMVEAMLKAMISHWSALKNTTVAGFRESFLQRSANLFYQAEKWHLEVEGKAFDMLLDQLPWSYNVIKTPWMDKPLHVQWR